MNYYALLTQGYYSKQRLVRYLRKPQRWMFGGRQHYL